MERPSMEKKPKAVSAGFFVARTPLLPFDALQSWSEGLQTPRLQPTAPLLELEAALVADLRRQRSRVSEWLSQPIIRESLYLASPGFFESLEHWEKNPDSDRGAKIEGSLVRYLQRMMTRATPFGLMAGISVGTSGPIAQFEVPPLVSLRRHTRLDMDYLHGLLSSLAKDVALRGRLLYFPNSSLYRVGDRFRYIERQVEGGDRKDIFTSCEVSELLNGLLVRARAGVFPAQLASEIVGADPEVTLEDAAGFIDELITAQVLVSELEPALTGEDPLEEALQTLEARRRDHPVIGVLRHVQAGLRELDEEVRGVEPSAYQALVENLERLNFPVERARVFQVELVKPGTGVYLTPAVYNSVASAAELLRRLTGRSGLTARAMQHFITSFKRRYEDAEVPLGLALDEESGIGFEPDFCPVEPSLIAGLGLRSNLPMPLAALPSSHLMELLGRAHRSGAQEIKLSEQDLSLLEDPHGFGRARGLSVNAVVVGKSAEAVNQGQFELVVSAGSPSGPAASNIARFCSADADLSRRVKELCASEAKLNPGTVLAEVVYLPNARNGNVMLRPVLREYEIPYLARSGASPERQLSIEDLHLSIREGRLILRSASLNKEVIPYSTHSFNFPSFGHSMARFLWFLSRDRSSTGIWSWGGLAAPFFPRLRAGKIILSLATWFLSAERVAGLTVQTRSGRWRAAQSMRSEERMPRYVQLAHGDLEQVLDFDSPLSVEAFSQNLIPGQRAKVVELYPGPDQLVFTGPEGRFTHELQVPLLLDAPLPAVSPIAPAAARRLFPGSDHLSVKLFTGPAGADRLLTELVFPLMEKWRANRQITLAYFVRFGDPDWHLRLRLLGTPNVLLTQVYPELLAAIAERFENENLWRVEQDTFTPETQRYGGLEGFALSETLFDFDSQAVLASLAALPGEANLDRRWRLALVSADRLFEDLGFELSTRLDVARAWRQGLEAEFTLDKDALSRICREERDAVAQLLDRRTCNDPGLEVGLAALERRTVVQKPACNLLRIASEAGRLSRSLPELAQSLVHLSINRWLRSDARAQERVLYELLERYYLSKQARLKSEVKATAVTRSPPSLDSH